MKNALVIMFVVGIAPLVSARLSLSAAGDGIISTGDDTYDIVVGTDGLITLSTDTDGAFVTYVQIENIQGEVDSCCESCYGFVPDCMNNGIARLSNPEDIWVGNRNSFNSSYGYQVTTSDSTTVPPAGPKWTFDIEAIGEVDETFVIAVDNWYDPQDRMIFTIVDAIIIDLSENLVNFTAQRGGANPSDKTFTITNPGPTDTLNWQITESCPWLSVSPLTGSSTGDPNIVTLSVDTTGLSGGIYQCVLMVSDPLAYNNPQTVDVSLFVVTGSLVCHWPFDCNANDIEGGFHGTFVGDAAITNTPGQFRKGSGALILDGSGDGVSTPYPGIPGAAERTTCAWFKCDGGTGDRLLFRYGNANVGGGWEVWIGHSGNIGVNINNGTERGNTTNLDDGQWHHVAVTFPPGSTLMRHTKIYVDGYEDTTYNWKDYQVVNTGTDYAFEIGSSDLSGYYDFNGQIDDVRVYDRALSDAEIYVLYNNCVGDIDGDDNINIADFANLASQWQDVPGTPSADIAPPPSGDNFVDLQDLQLLALSWLSCGNPVDPGCTGPLPITWVYIDDPNFTGMMSKYETTNAQYCGFLNAALASGDIAVGVDNIVYGAIGSNGGADFDGLKYFETSAASTLSQITYSGGTFSVRSRDGYDMSDHPVVKVNWYGATAFCNYYGYRLPTERQWQGVADYDGSYIYGCGTTIDQSKANYEDTGSYPNPLNLSDQPFTSPVNHYPSYGYGLNDMAGNVWEWTSTGSSMHIVRGGSWFSTAGHNCEVSFGYSFISSTATLAHGFRVVKDLD